MNPVILKKQFRKDLTFFGGICIRYLLPNGSPGHIRDEVNCRADIPGKKEDTLYELLSKNHSDSFSFIAVMF